MIRDMLYEKIVESLWVARELGELNANNPRVEALRLLLDDTIPVLDGAFVVKFTKQFGHPPDTLSGVWDSEALRRGIAKSKT